MGHAGALWIAGPAGRLQATLRLAERPRALAVVAHPHPEYGGSFDHPVVFHCDRELNRAGLVTLRFNFRGVGSSEGVHDGGRGEVDDFAAAARWLEALARRLPLVAVGYSFGSWCAARHAVADPRVIALVALGLPLAHYDFGVLRELHRPVVAIHGTADELSPVAQVRALVEHLEPPGVVHAIEGVPHSFAPRAHEAAAAVVAAVDSILGS